jgi:hypothetical protein
LNAFKKSYELLVPLVESGEKYSSVEDDATANEAREHGGRGKAFSDGIAQMQNDAVLA